MHQIIYAAAEKRSDGVHAFGKDKRYLAYTDVAKYSSAAAGGHSEKDGEEGVFPVAGICREVDSRDCEYSESYCVKNIVDAVDRGGFRFKTGIQNAGYYEGHDARNDSRNEVRI